MNANIRRFSTCLMLWLAFAPGCSGGGSEGFMQFVVEGQTYEVDNVEFVAQKLSGGDRYFLALGQIPVSAVPGFAIQWQMDLTSVEDLAGRELEFLDVNDPDLGVLAQLSITDDLAAHASQGSTLRLRISRIEDDYVVGSFSASDLIYVSMTEDIVREVDATGDFRATLVIQ